MTVRWTRTLVAPVIVASLSGCSQLAELPNVTTLPQRVLTSGEQQAKIANIAERGQKHQTEAAKEIEEDR